MVDLGPCFHTIKCRESNTFHIYSSKASPYFTPHIFGGRKMVKPLCRKWLADATFHLLL